MVVRVTTCRCRRPRAREASLASTSFMFMFERRAGAGLVDVDRELAVVLARGDLVGGGGDRVGDVAVEHAELCVGQGGGLLDAREGHDLGALEASAGDREVLDRTLRLRAVQGVHGNAHLAHRVVLDAVLFGCGSHGASLGRSGAAPKTVNACYGPATGRSGGFRARRFRKRGPPGPPRAVSEADDRGPPGFD